MADMQSPPPVIQSAATRGAGALLVSSLRYLWKRRKDYDVIHVLSFDSQAFAGAIVKRLFPQKRYVLGLPRFEVGSTVDRLSKSRLGRRRLEYVLGKADAIIAPCAETAAALGSMGVGEGRIALIPDGVDSGFFSPINIEGKRVLKRSFGIKENAFVGIVVARLVPRKNVQAVLEAWERVVAAHPDAALIVVGDGPEGTRLSAYAEAHFRGRSVVFTGKTSREEGARLFKTADVYVSYSRSEGMANTTLEAMSSGLPVVAPRGPSIDELIDHTRTGFVFDPERPPEGTDYLMRLAEDPDLARRMSFAVRRVVQDRYSFESIARRLEKLYTGEIAPEDRPDPVRKVPAEPVSDAPGKPGALPSTPQPAVQHERPHRKSRRSRKKRRKKSAKVKY
jgi:glycosyltransferase involved in cell wall biosynthesis